MEAHYELSADHVEHHTRGAEIHLTAQVDAKRLETALRCQAARVNRQGPGPRAGVLEVSAMIPEIVVTSEASGMLVVITAPNDKEGERILASARALVPQH